MASPTLELICCSNRSNQIRSSTLDTVQDVYQITAIVSSVFSIAGATFTLLPRKVGGIFRKRMLEGRQYNIIQLLAIADLMACLGIICLESLLFCKATGSDLDDNAIDHGFCLFFTAWIQYFYIATYFLTASYAIDVYLMLKGVKRGVVLSVLMYIVCFLCPLFLVAIGIVALYEPTKDTGLTCEGNNAINLIPLYLASYLPMVMVMFMNPIIYCLSANKVKPIIKGIRGQYTDKERAYLQAVQKKFLRIVAVFLLCWWPNVILGAINLYMATKLNRVKPTLIGEPRLSFLQIVTIVLWFCMGVLNPLQAFLNTLVYVGWGGCCNIALPSWCPQRQRNPKEDFEESETNDYPVEGKQTTVGNNQLRSLHVNEHTPLITTRPPL